jgi:hypothetical protein
MNGAVFVRNAAQIERLVACTLIAATMSIWAAPVRAAPASQGWTTYTVEGADLRFDYPGAIFTDARGDPTDGLSARTADRAGRVFATSDGRAILQFGTFPNLDTLSVDELRKRAIAASYGDAKIEYNRATENWYVLSGVRGADTFYERVQFSCGGRRLDLFAITYPSGEARVFDAIVDEMARRARSIYANIRCKVS